MSLIAQQWVYKVFVGNAACKAVLVALAFHANDFGEECFPGLDKLAEETEYTKRALYDMLSVLEHMGLISRLGGGRGRGNRISYKLHLAKGEPDAPYREAREKVNRTTKGEPDAPFTGNEKGEPGAEKVNLVQKKGEPHDIAIKEIEPPIEPPIEPSGGSARAKPLPITDDFIEGLVQEFAPTLGGAENVREHIADALNHKAMDKRKDKRLYLRNWIKRDAADFQAKRAPPNGHKSGHGQAKKSSYKGWFVEDG